MRYGSLELIYDYSQSIRSRIRNKRLCEIPGLLVNRSRRVRQKGVWEILIVSRSGPDANPLRLGL